MPARNGRTVFLLLSLFWLCALGACAATSESSDQFDGESVQQTVLGHTMNVPKGFTMNVFAEGLGGLRFSAPRDW